METHEPRKHPNTSTSGADAAPPSPASRSSRRLTVTSPGDLVASVPVLLGFVPTDSVVVLSVGRSNGPHARVDLPDGSRGTVATTRGAGVVAAEVVEALVPALASQGVRQVAVLVHATLLRARAVMPELVTRFREHQIDVLAAVGVSPHHWIDLSDAHQPGEPHPYDLRDHRFVAQAVAEGKVILGSRADLASTLEPLWLRDGPMQGTETENTAVAVVGTVDERVAQLRSILGRLTGVDRSAESLEAVTNEAATRVTPGDAKAVAALVQDPAVRDAAWAWVTRAEVPRHVHLWRQVLVRARTEEVPAVASVLAFHAWLSGDGALAWCALDRASETGESTSLAHLVRDLLERAVPPATWSPVLVTP